MSQPAYRCSTRVPGCPSGVEAFERTLRTPDLLCMSARRGSGVPRCGRGDRDGAHPSIHVSGRTACARTALRRPELRVSAEISSRAPPHWKFGVRAPSFTCCCSVGWRRATQTGCISIGYSESSTRGCGAHVHARHNAPVCPCPSAAQCARQNGGIFFVRIAPRLQVAGC